VLWIFDTNAFCIEAKNEKTTPIFKKDAQQLMLSKRWCVDHTNLSEAVIIPVFATDQIAADRAEDVFLTAIDRLRIGGSTSGKCLGGDLLGCLVHFADQLGDGFASPYLEPPL
jgi:hypothetical protein